MKYIYSIFVVFLLVLTASGQKRPDTPLSHQNREPVTPSDRLEQARMYLTEMGDRPNVATLLKSKAYKQIPKQWIGLSATDTGYVEYEPCNGINHSIEINDDIIIVNFGLESLGYVIDNVIKSNHGFILKCTSTYGSVEMVFRQVRQPEGTYIISWTGMYVYQMYAYYQWLVTPVVNRYRFDYITNPCPENIIPEKKFNEIHFDSLILK